jgi:hypothetical protein
VCRIVVFVLCGGDLEQIRTLEHIEWEMGGKKSNIRVTPEYL